jgi:hypothetical protein
MADTVLPPLTTDLRCAPQAVELGLDPLGTASGCRTLVLVESAGAWPSSIEESDDLRDLPSLGPDCRVLATRGEDGPQPTVTVWRAGDHSRFGGVDYRVGPGRLPEVLEDLGAGRPAAELGGVEELGPAPPEVLICGHGRRDRCCGSFGIGLLAEARGRSARWPGVRVRRCSHTGGHRFAPTGITLPDGRVWAFLDIDLLDAAVTDRPEPRLAQSNRGLLALDAWAQVAEGALYRAVGPAWSRMRSSLERIDDGAVADRRRYRVTWAAAGLDTAAGPETAAVVTVAQTGTEPVPPCGAPLEEATKSSPVFEIVSIDPLTH